MKQQKKKKEQEMELNCDPKYYFENIQEDNWVYFEIYSLQ